MNRDTESIIIIFHCFAIIFFTIGFPYVVTKQGLILSDYLLDWSNTMRVAGSLASVVVIAKLFWKDRQRSKTGVAV